MWIIAATNEDLQAAIRAGRFREDLYHRLSVITLSLPPLRERGDDVLQLASHFLARACADYDLAAKVFTPDARAALAAYRWPGNVRELANVMERVALLSDVRAITADMLGLPIAPPPGAPPPEPPLRDAMELAERERLLHALRETDWNVSQAAARLGVGRNTIRYRISKFGLRPGDEAEPARRPGGESPKDEPAPSRPVDTGAPPRATVRWEQRRLTLLYAALAASREETALFETSRALDVCIQKVDSFAGRIEELSQGAVLAVFGLDPLEDAADRAALTAMALEKVAQRARGASAARPDVRLAIHTAHFLVGRVGDRIGLEESAKLRARQELETLIAQAAPGTTVVSAATARFLERRFDLAPTGAPPDAGGPTYRLLGREHAGFGRRLARFVGRREELVLLGSRLESALRGRGQVVGIGGAAGMGKSRLLFEFRQGLADQQVNYLEGRCASYWSGIPYLPVVDLLRAGFRLRETDPPEKITRKVQFGLRRLGMDAKDAAPYILRLLGVKEGEDDIAVLSPEAVNLHTLQALHHMTLQSSRRRPLVLAVEDVHWVDSASAAFLAAVVESLVGARILVIVTCRPGHALPWAEKSYATHLSLQALDTDDSRLVLEASWPSGGIPEEVARTILEKAEGNPFFVEELARAVSEEGPEGEVRIPDTIQEVLLARIERLPAHLRDLLQAAAVLGREVSPRLLGLMRDEPAGLDDHLRELARLEFIHGAGGTAEPLYVFTHTLTHDVAYDSVPADVRQSLHAAAGRVLETLYADRLDEATDRLAHHYGRTAQPAKAVAYLSMAALKAARSYAHLEAIAALDEALLHADRLPPPERDRRFAELVLRRVESLWFLGRFAEALDQLLRAQPRIEGIGDEALAGQYHFWLGNIYGSLGEAERAGDSARRAVVAAQRCGDTATLGKAFALLAQESSWVGRPAEGVEHGRRAIELLERSGEPWWLGFAHWIVGINHTTAGNFDQALEAEARARVAGEAIGDPRIQSYATWTTGWIHALRGEADIAIEACQRALAFSLDPVNTATVIAHLGHAYLGKGDPDRAIPLLEQAVAMMSQFRSRRLQGRVLTFLGEGYLARGQLDRARQVVEEGLELAREARYGYNMGWAQWILGQIAMTGGRAADAYSHLREALEIFTSVGARFMAARVHLALAEVERKEGRPDEAVPHLEEALRTFRTLKVPRYEERVLALMNPPPSPAP